MFFSVIFSKLPVRKTVTIILVPSIPLTDRSMFTDSAPHKHGHTLHHITTVIDGWRDERHKVGWRENRSIQRKKQPEHDIRRDGVRELTQRDSTLTDVHLLLH